MTSEGIHCTGSTKNNNNGSLQINKKVVKAGSGLEVWRREDGGGSRGIKDGKRVGWGIVRVQDVG